MTTDSWLKTTEVYYLAVLEVRSPKWVKVWAGLGSFWSLQGRIHFLAAQNQRAAVTPSLAALFHLQSHHVTLTLTCISLPLLRTLRIILPSTLKIQDKLLILRSVD